MRDVIEELRRRAEPGASGGREAAPGLEGAALATVVATRGSTFRKAGAHMLIFPGGDVVGSISGGCLEGDVQELAAEVVASGVPRLLTYDTTADDDRVWGLGLGCNGIVEVFLEPLDWAAGGRRTGAARAGAGAAASRAGAAPAGAAAPGADWFEVTRRHIEAGVPVAVATVVEVRAAAPDRPLPEGLPAVRQRWVVADTRAVEGRGTDARGADGDGADGNGADGRGVSAAGDFPPGALRDRVTADAFAMLQRGASGTREYAAPGSQPVATARPDASGQPAGRRSATVRVYIESIRPAASVVIFGAGHDVVPVVEECHRLGWRVTVVDMRAHLLHSGRFPGAAEFVCARPDDAWPRLRFGPDSAALVMTHNFNRDLEILPGLIRSDVPYIGVLGPRQRLDQLLADLEAAGTRFAPAQLRRVFAPVGLDLGTESPEEIAVAVVAELLAVRRGRPGGHLRDREAPIHDLSPVDRAV